MKTDHSSQFIKASLPPPKTSTRQINVCFAVVGAENLSVQALSATLKAAGHRCSYVFDPAFFDDKNFLSYASLGKFFSKEKQVIELIIASKPDLLAISVMTPTFNWANRISEGVKKALPDLPIVYGGIHPTLVPEKTLLNSPADIVCIGEGDHALVELANSLSDGKLRTNIPSLWFKTKEGIITNPRRETLTEIDSLPEFDKDLHNHYRVSRNNLLLVLSRGCPFACSFCSLYKYAEDSDLQKIPRVRLRSPDLAIKEIKRYQRKYQPTWIEFKDNTFTANRPWLNEFLPRLKNEIGLPFKCFVHPATMNIEVAQLLKDSGCWGVQMGVESLSEQVRNNIINRKEKNNIVLRAFQAMDEVGLRYSTDYILGLPQETEEDLRFAARTLIELKSLHRVSPFFIAYLPKHPLTETAHRLGILSDKDIENLENGNHDHYLGLGSISAKPEIRKLLSYKYFFRLIPHLPRPVNRFLYRTKAYKLFPRIFFFGEFVVFLDVALALCGNEPDIRSYLKHYLVSLWKLITFRYFPKPSDRKPEGRVLSPELAFDAI